MRAEALVTKVPHAQRRWSHGDIVVLRALALNGETLASLARRLGRPRGIVALKCAELMLPLAT